MPVVVKHYAIIGAAALLTLFANLGGARLWDRDEPRNAGCALEMRDRGDWVTPVFNGELRTAKPVLLYWLILSAYELFGVTEFAARFWSAALGCGTALATYHLGRRLFDPETGLWAAVILVTSLMFDLASRAATPDAPLIFFSTLALTVYAHGVFRRDETEAPHIAFPSLPMTVLLYASLGFGVLAKGPVGCVLPTAVIGLFLLILRRDDADREPIAASGRERAVRFLGTVGRTFAPRHFLKTCWRLRPLTAIGVIAAVAMPWYVAVALRTDGEWVREFLLMENLRRAAEPMENHRGSILYYPIAIVIGFFPWSVLLTPIFLDAIPRAVRTTRTGAALVFLFCWVGVFVGVFSLARTKLPSYVTPTYPAWALLAAGFLIRWVRGQATVSARWPRLSFINLAAVGVALAIALPLVAPRFFPGEEWWGIIGAPLIVGGAAGYAFLRKDQRRRAAVGFALTAAAFTALVFGVITDRASRHQRSGELLASIRSDSAALLGSFACLEPSWVFYSKRPIYELGFTGAMSLPPIDGRKRPPVDARSFLAQSQDAYIITTDQFLHTLLAALPPDVEVVARAPNFLRNEQLCLIGRRPHRNANSQAASPLR